MKQMHRLVAVLIVALTITALTPAIAQDKSDDGIVFVIPIENQIESALLYVIRRGVTEAQRTGADAIVFVMDTPGGTLDAAGEIIRIINSISVPTYTLVQNEAFSAGALIALATQHIYMEPGSVIGDAMPIMMTPTGGVEEMPEDIQEKMVSAVSALARSAAEQGGHDKQLAEAMVRRELEYKIEEEVICPEGQLLTLTNIEASRLVGEEMMPLLSSGTVENLTAMLATIGHASADVRHLEVTTAENMARWIAGFAPIFLIIGVVGVYIEIRTPGFGLPGIVGGIALVLFFWGHHIAGLAGMEDLVIFLIGVVLLALEIFVIPGFGAAGISGICLITWAILSAMIRHYPGMPWYVPESWSGLSTGVGNLGLTIIGSFFLAITLGWLIPLMCPSVNRLVLQKATKRDEGYAASSDTHDLEGLVGVALAQLRPAGPAQIGDRRIDAITRGEFIAEGTKIKVVETHGNRIIVEACDAHDEEITDNG